MVQLRSQRDGAWGARAIGQTACLCRGICLHE